MPIKDGRIYVTVTCDCGEKTEVMSDSYGSYCRRCAKPIFIADHNDEIICEIRKVVHDEKINIRKSKKEKTFLNDDFSVAGSSLLSTCFECGTALTAGQFFIVDGEIVCKNCYETKVPKCKGCGARHFKKNLTNGLCEGCKVSFMVCKNCGNTFDKRKTKPIVLEGKEWCDKCVRSYLDSKGILFNNYSYKPRPSFFGEKDPGYYFGVEDEMDNSDRRNEFMALSHCEEGYYKSDGSLGSDGCEFVTYPCTLQYHMTEFPWEKVFAAAKMCGFRSHTGSNGPGSGAHPTCGLHIHVSKVAFGRTTDERDKREAKLLVLFDKFWPQLVIFSRRDKSSLSTWARRYASFDVTKDQLTEIISKAKNENGGGKHLAVNFNGNGGETIEFRLFRGTLNRETLIASIQLIDMLIQSTKLPPKKVQELTWEEFCEEGCEKYDEFKGYISRLRGMKRSI